MTKRQVERYRWLCNAVEPYGIGWEDLGQLLRASRTLSCWGEHECNGTIQRDEDTGIPYWWSPDTGERLSRAPDREVGALKRAERIAAEHGLTIYHQPDPRGCALYLLRPGDVPAGERAESYYTRGIAVTVD